jgi:O-antigen/teichoic acid export membrane protein
MFAQIGSIVKLYVGLFYLPDRLTDTDLSAVEPVTRLVGFGTIPMLVMGQVAVKYLSSYQARDERGKIKCILLDMGLLTLVFSLVMAGVLVASYGALSVRLHFEGQSLLPGLLALLVLSCWQPYIAIVLQGLQRFRVVMVNSMAQPVVLLGLLVGLLPALHFAGFLWAKCLSAFVPILVGLVALRVYLAPHVALRSYRDEWRSILAFTWPLGISAVAGSVQGFVEPLVIRHWLPAADGAGYYMACRFGWIPMYLVSTIGFVVFPLFSLHHEKGNSTHDLFREAMRGTAWLGGLAVVGLGVLSPWLFTLYAPWKQYAEFAPLVWQIGVVGVLQSLVSTYAMHRMARRDFRYLWVTVPVMLAESVWLYVTFGWGAFRGILPVGLWSWVLEHITRSVDYVVLVMLVARVVTVALLAIQAHWGGERRSV